MNIYILHYRENWHTDACVAALLADPYVTAHCRVIVIDNGSPEPYVPKTDGAILMRLEDNLHLIPAFNAGLQMFPADVYWCLNNDVRVSLGCAEKVYRAFDNPDVGIVAPGSSDATAGVLYVPHFASDLVGDATVWTQDVFTTHVDNHAWAFSHDLTEAIGYPDADGHPHRANWYANRLYCYRAREATYRVVALRSAYVEHLHEAGYDPEADWHGRKWIASRLGEKVEAAL